MVSPTKSIILAIAPKFTAFLSFCGSFGIVLKVLGNARRRKKSMHRIVMGMSICDILATIWYFAGTWAIPAGTLSWFGDGETETIFWAAGDQKGISCSIAGFFNQFAVATPLYNLTLSIFYLLVVNYGWKDARIAKNEWLFHTIPVGYAIVTATFAAATDLYGHVEWTCWILPGELFDDTQELTPIQSKFRWIQWISLFGVVWMCIIVVSVIFVILYRKMKFLEQKMSRYSFSSLNLNSDHSARDRSSTISSSIINSSGRGSVSMQETSGSHAIEAEDSNPTRRCASKIDIELGEDAVVSDIDDDGGDGGEESDLNGIFVERHTIGRLDNAVEELKEPDRCSTDEEKEEKDPFDVSDATSPEFTIPPQEEDGTNRLTRVSWIDSSINQRLSNLKTNRNDNNGSSRNRRGRRDAAKSKQIAVQGILYVGAFYITWLFPTISRITELVAGKNYFPIQFLDTFLIPLQGFLNFFIYIRPRFLNYRKLNVDAGFWKALKTVVFENHN